MLKNCFETEIQGACCLKCMKTLVKETVNFQTYCMQKHGIIYWKNVNSFCNAPHLCNKKILTYSCVLQYLMNSGLTTLLSNQCFEQLGQAQ